MQHAVIADEMNGAAVGTKVPHDSRKRIAVGGRPRYESVDCHGCQAFNDRVSAMQHSTWRPGFHATRSACQATAMFARK
jgi:hypothetical protein